MVSLLLLIVLPSWSWLLATIVIVGRVSIIVIASYFVVMVNCCQPCCLLFLCGHGCMAPSLLLLFLSWPWTLGTIHVTTYFMVVVI
jgi:hypothetical protein